MRPNSYPESQDMDSNLERNIKVFKKNSIDVITCTYWLAGNDKCATTSSTKYSESSVQAEVYYDAAHNIDKGQYKVGAVVLLRKSKKLTKKGSKMEPNWIGPYVVHEVLSKGTCRLSQVKKPNKVLAQKFNISRLKLYHQNGLLTMSLYYVL